MRGLALVLLLSILLGGCAVARRHPRATVVIASTTIGAVASGLMSGECTASPDESCGAARAAAYTGAGAVGGALLGMLVALEIPRDETAH